MIYVTGDTHIPIDISKLNTRNFPDQKGMTRGDYVIVLGDFGLYWHVDKEYRNWLGWLKEKKFTLLWIDGNHENFDWVNGFPVEEWHGGKVHWTEENIIHLMRGQVFSIEGKKFFTMGGAFSTDQEFREQHMSWWPEEEPSQEEEQEGIANLKRNNYSVDFVLTHAAPISVVHQMFGKYLYGTSRTERVLDGFLKAIAGFDGWYFGHYHADKDAGKFHAMYDRVARIV